MIGIFLNKLICNKIDFKNIFFIKINYIIREIRQMSQKQLITIYHRLSIIAKKTYQETLYNNHAKNIVTGIDIHVKKNGDHYDGINQLLNFLHFPEYSHIKSKKDSSGKL